MARRKRTLLTPLSHVELRKMRDEAVSYLRNRRISEFVIQHNSALFYELASRIDSGSSNGGKGGIDPRKVMLLALYHENFKSPKMLPERVRSEIGDLFSDFVVLKRKDVSEKSVWTFYSELAERNISLLMFRIIDLTHLPREKDILIDSFKFDYKRCDRQLHNLAQSMLYVYAPFADIMGLSATVKRLKDFSTSILYPQLYEEVSRRINDQMDLICRVRADFDSELEVRMNEASALLGIEFKYFGEKHAISRIKSIGSIVTKLVARDIPPESVMTLNDIVAFTVLTKTVDEAYVFADMLREQYNVRDEDFSDYIKNPRGETGYQSLHVDIVREGIRIEVQIKTPEMYERCDKGDWAHALMKPYKVDRDKLILMSNYSDMLRDASTDEIESIAMGLRSERIRVSVQVEGNELSVEMPYGARVFDLVCRVSDPMVKNIVSSAATGKKYSHFDSLSDGGRYVVERLDDPLKMPRPLLNQLNAMCITPEAHRAVRSMLRKNGKRRRKAR